VDNDEDEDEDEENNIDIVDGKPTWI
jgi:hypothetical protein